MRYLNIASPVEDNELIQGCLRQDPKYQEAVFRRYAGKLMVVSLRYARHRMEAEDILQDAFIRIFDHIDQFQGKGSLEGWMRRIVVNTALKNIDKKIQKKNMFWSFSAKPPDHFQPFRQWTCKSQKNTFLKQDEGNFSGRKKRLFGSGRW